MLLRRALSPFVLALALACAAAAETPWRPLFDAALADAEAKPGVWSWQDGELTANADEVLWTRTDHERFELELEFKNAPGTNSGVILYAAPEKGWVPHSLEIQLADDYAAKWASRPPTWHCGALFGHLAPAVRAVKPAGEWNTLRIVADGPAITVVLNGLPVVDADLRRWTQATVNPDGTPIPKWLTVPKAELPTRGRIGLQGKHGDAPVWFRALRWRPLPPR
jgi:hypothetical protein